MHRSGDFAGRNQQVIRVRISRRDSSYLSLPVAREHPHYTASFVAGTTRCWCAGSNTARMIALDVFCSISNKVFRLKLRVTVRDKASVRVALINKTSTTRHVYGVLDNFPDDYARRVVRYF